MTPSSVGGSGESVRVVKNRVNKGILTRLVLLLDDFYKIFLSSLCFSLLPFVWLTDIVFGPASCWILVSRGFSGRGNSTFGLTVAFCCSALPGSYPALSLAMRLDSQDCRDRAACTAAVTGGVAIADVPANGSSGVEGGFLPLLHGGVEGRLHSGVS